MNLCVSFICVLLVSRLAYFNQFLIKGSAVANWLTDWLIDWFYGGRRHLLCLSSGSASSEGLGLLRSSKATLLTSSAAVKCDGLAFGAFDVLRHAMSPFSVFLSSLSGAQRILGFARPQRIVMVHPPKTGRRRSIRRSLQIEAVFTWRCDVIDLQMLKKHVKSENRCQKSCQDRL